MSEHWDEQERQLRERKDRDERHREIGRLLESILSTCPEVTLYNRMDDTQQFVATDGRVNGSGTTLLDAIRQLLPVDGGI